MRRRCVRSVLWAGAESFDLSQILERTSRRSDLDLDIDLLVETSLSGAHAYRGRIDAMTDIQLALGDQKIDIVITDLDTTYDRPIVRIARKQGVQL